jgi:hypothetical protein
MRRVLRTDLPNNLGTRLPVPPRQGGLGPGLPVAFLQIRADDGDAHNLNIVLMPVVESSAPTPHGPCVAVIEWGTGSGSVSAEVDVGKGTQLQLSASFVGISVRNDGAVDNGTESSVDPAPGIQEVVAMVAGYGGRVAFGKATRTFYFASIAPAGLVEATVPNFAKSVLVTRHPPNTSVVVELYDNLGTNLRASLALLPGAVPLSLDLFGLTAFVRVRNVGATDVSFLQIAFELAL